MAATLGIHDREVMDTPARRASRAQRARHLAAAIALARDQAGVISLAQLRSCGITRSQLRAHVAARRWQRVHTQVVAVTTGPLTDTALCWAAVLEGGPGAHLDGASALIAEGLTGFTWDVIRVSVPMQARARSAPGLQVVRTRRYDSLTVQPSGIPRTRPDVAAVRAALWAVSDKQAALLLTMPVQQRLTTAERIGASLLSVRRHQRRTLLHATVLDLLDGVRSVSEAEFAAECRRRGLPKPSRQVVRRAKDGTYYLDVYWEEWGVVVEIDGIQHTWATNVVGDALRQNAVTLESAIVLRLPLLGLRVAADDFFVQIEEALRAQGCPLPRTCDDAGARTTAS
jgi:very-short-patch-repair endonuclease